MKKATRPEQGLGLTYEGGRPREEDVLTRRRLSLWDRFKWLVLLVLIWLLLVWSLMADNPLVGFARRRPDRGADRLVGLRPDRA